MTGHIFLEGEIGTTVTTETVRNDIALYPQATEFIVHINSEGGDVYQGYNIGHIIRNLGKPTTAQIGALCASIATFAASCCDRVIMAPQGDFMIHLPTGTLSGNAEDLRRGAAQLDRIKSELIDRYMSRVGNKGITREQVSQMIDKETSMSPQEALKMGFIDDVQEKMKAVAKFDINKFDMSITREEAKGLFAELGNKIDKLFAKKFKNVAVTLADGTIINSDAESPDAIVGSMVTDETGAALADGTYETADGYALVVAGGKVASMDPVQPAEGEEMAKLKQENEALKQQLAAQTQATAAQKVAVETVAKELAEFKNQTEEFKKLKTEFENLKNQTFGDPNPPPAATQTHKPGIKELDPMIKAMAETMGEAYKTSRFN